MAPGRLNKRRGGSDTEDSHGSLRAKNTELFSREISVDINASKKIYSRDADNLYPLRMEKIINSSPTGRRCANLMAKYIGGNGNEINFPIGKGKYINDIIRSSSTEIAYHNGVYFRLRYVIDQEASMEAQDLIFKSGSVEVMDGVIMAKSKEDDNAADGKFYALPDNGAGGIVSDDVSRWFYPFNQDPKAIAYQMHNDCKIKGIKDPTPEDLIQNYRGQIFYLNLTPKFVYALPVGDMVYNDMDTEHRISIYNNTQTRQGFLGKTQITKFGDPDDETDDFDDEVKTFLGAENSSSVLIVDIPQGVNVDLDKAFMVNQLKPQFDDKLFDTTIKTCRVNIMGAFNNIPEALVFASSSMFSPTAETINELKRFYWEQNEAERSALEQTLRLFGYDVNILPLVEEIKEGQSPEEKIKREAQATLKGSVGGVTALLALQAAVGAGTTDLEAAVVIVEEIYGIEKETARKMLGTPKKIEENA